MPKPPSHEQLRDHLRHVLRLTADLVGERSLGELPSSVHTASAMDALDSADRAVSAWVGRHRGSHASAAVVVLNEISAVRLTVQAHEVVRRRESFARLSRALQQLHLAESVDQLAEQVPGQVADLGFNRAMFSWVEQARWVPQAYHTGNGPEEARAVMAAGLPPYWHTRDLLEGEMVRHKLPILVRDALGHPRVHRDIQAVMHSRSYVAAPLVRRAQVVGFVHADENVDTGAVDEVDRDVVSLFADGLVLAIDRVRALEEFAALRSRMSVQKSTLLELIAEFDGASPAQGPARSERDADRPPRRHVSPDWSEVLTRREEQVLGLIADGLNNSQIAERLYITEGTAKTHVKHVLRKLGADNRAQAAARFRQG